MKHTQISQSNLKLGQTLKPWINLSLAILATSAIMTSQTMAQCTEPIIPITNTNTNIGQKMSITNKDVNHDGYIDEDDQLPIMRFTETFGDVYYPKPVNYTIPNYRYASSNTRAGQFAILSGAIPNWHPAHFWNINGTTTGSKTDAYLAVNGSTKKGIFYYVDIVLAGNAQYTITFNHASGKTGIDRYAYALQLELLSPSCHDVLFSSRTDRSNSTIWKEHRVILTAPEGGLYRLQLINTTLAAAGNDFAIDDITITANMSMYQPALKSKQLVILNEVP